MSDLNGINGSASEAAIAETLQDEVTVGYRPVLPLESLWMGGSDMPQITLRRDLEFMQMHPIVITALEYYKSGIAGAEFWGGPDHLNPGNEMGKPISQDQRVAEFVLAHVERFWQRGVPMVQEGGYPYGWAAGEHIYKEVSGMLVWSHMKDFHPNDAYIMTANYQPIGVRIKNIRGRQPVDLWLSSESVPSKACWYAHRPRFNQFYGRSQLIGAWRPWRRLGWRDAVEQVIDAAVYRAGYHGPIVRFPPEDMQTAQTGIPATKLDAQGNPRRNARDVARQMGEWAKAGASFTMSSAVYPDSGGKYKWDLTWPDHVMDVRPLIEAARALEDHIMLGIGVPPELVRAGGTGSGYSGRSVPREAFLDGQQKVADAILQMFVEHVVKPLVLWNFGDVPFEISCKSLLKSQSQDKQGDDQQNGGGSPGQKAPARKAEQPPSDQPSPPPQPGPALSVDSDARARVLDIVRRVRSKSAALSADSSGHEHKGKGPGGGQFVSKGKGGSSDGTRFMDQDDYVVAEQDIIKEDDKKEGESDTADNGKRAKGFVHKSKVEPPADAGKPATREEHVAAINRAVDKAKLAPAPTEQEVKENLEGIAKLGANKYRKNLNGNSKDRRNRRVKLLKEFGNGETCPCIYCGIKVGEGSLEQDKIVTTAAGGRYRISNLVPSCSSCNKRRGDDSFEDAIKKAVEYAAEEPTT